MQIKLKEYSEDEKEELLSFLTGERWEHHSTPQLNKEKVTEQLQNGYFDGTGKKTFWVIIDEGIKIGLIRLFDLGEGKDDDETPLFDIKIKSEFRGKGSGKAAVKLLVDYVFTNYPAKHRFEATTRIDNIAMRRVLERCGFVKEAHHRLAWPDEHGNKYDCAGYAILRNDWENKTVTKFKFDS